MSVEKVTSLTQEEMDCIIYDSREGDIETIKEIFNEIDPELLLTIKDDITLSTPIHMAAANGHLELIKYLFSIIPKADAIKLANQKNETGNTALHWAAFNGHLSIVELLCGEYEANVFDKNESNHDAIFEAENNNQEEVENWLLNKYAVEDTVKVEDHGKDTKITYTPGTESKEADDRANQAKQEQSKTDESTVETIGEKTEKLSI